MSGSGFTVTSGPQPSHFSHVIDDSGPNGNGDGVLDAGEDGVPNVEVTLTPPAGVDLGNGPGQPITTMTVQW